MMKMMFSLYYKWLILALAVLVTGLGLPASFSNNVVSAPKLAALEPECGVLTLETPLQPEVEPFPPGPGDQANRNPDIDETDTSNRVEQLTGEDSAPPCPQLDLFKSKSA